MKKILKNDILHDVIIIIISSFVGLALICLTSMIPQKSIEDNVRESISTLYAEGAYWYALPNIEGTMMDNFSDALKLDITYMNGGGLESSLLSRMEFKESTPLSSMYLFLNYEEEGKIVNYPRYWHGYQTWLRPALCFFSISEIRMINMCFQMVLITILCILVYKWHRALIIPLLGWWISLNPISIMLSLQYSTIFYATIISCILVMKANYGRKKLKIETVYLGCGIWIAFFDLLTYPLVSLCIPLITDLVLQYKKENRFVDIWKREIKCAYKWGIGYAGMWASKWILATIFTDYNIIQNAIKQIGVRTSHEYLTEHYTLFTTVYSQLATLYNKPLLLFIIIVTVIVFVLFVRYKIKTHEHLHEMINIQFVLSVVIVSIAPFLWYDIVMNHSYIHSFFVYRLLSICVFGYLCILCCNNKVIKKAGSTSIYMKNSCE